MLMGDVFHTRWDIRAAALRIQLGHEWMYVPFILQAVAQLVALGFDTDAAKSALEATGGNAEDSSSMGCSQCFDAQTWLRRRQTSSLAELSSPELPGQRQKRELSMHD